MANVYDEVNRLRFIHAAQMAHERDPLATTVLELVRYCDEFKAALVDARLKLSEVERERAEIIEALHLEAEPDEPGLFSIPAEPEPINELTLPQAVAKAIQLCENDANPAESRVAAAEGLAQALTYSDSLLSLLRHRQEHVIQWGTTGMTTISEVDRVIGESRVALDDYTKTKGD